MEQHPFETTERIPLNGFLANVRNTDKKVLGVVTDKYRVVQNEEAFAFTDTLLGEGLPMRRQALCKRAKRYGHLPDFPGVTSYPEIT